MRVPPRASLIAVALVAICLGVPRVTGNDPMLVTDVALLGALVVWALLVGREVLRGRKLGRALMARSTTSDIAGVRCRVVAGAGRQAFVLGAFRPTIYVSERLLVELPSHELRAVVLHEEHHRRTHGPLRASALRALRDLAVLSKSARVSLAERLADLEREADAFAMGLGTSPTTLAAALVSVDATTTGSAAAFVEHGGRGIDFGAAGDRRVSALLAADAGGADPAASVPPLEWLLPVAGLVLPLACYLAGLAPRM